MGAHCFCTVTGPTAIKGEAVKRLAKTLNVDLKNAAVFGDAENDISMLKLVKEKGGLSVVVGNAMQKQETMPILLPLPLPKTVCKSG